MIGILDFSNKGNIKLIDNFLTSDRTICSSKLCNRSEGLICAPTSFIRAKLSIPPELGICYGRTSK
ncbi:MAG TPA: hypothetical protein VIP56_02710, partial [Nitrososphaeraceae archaeon]